MFSANNSNTQIRVKGWKVVKNNEGVRLRYNGEICELTVAKDVVNLPTTGETLIATIPQEYTPYMTVLYPTNPNNIQQYIKISSDTGKIMVISFGDTQPYIYSSITYAPS